jgi:manganese transport protein
MWVKVLAWACAILIVGLNFRLVAGVALPWISESPTRAVFAVPIALAILGLLGYVTFVKTKTPGEREIATLPPGLETPVYRRILVPLDHSEYDQVALSHATAMARQHGSLVHLLHVEEDATSQLFGAQASTAEVTAGERYFRNIAKALEDSGIRTEVTVVAGRSPQAEIIKIAKATVPDLVVMGAHGHTGVKDLIFGATINGVRHAIAAPVLVVRAPMPRA